MSDIIQETEVPAGQRSDDGSDGLVRRFGPLLVLGLGLLAFFVFDLKSWFSLSSLQTHRADLQAFVEGNAVLATLVMGGAYALAVAFSLPVGAVFTLGVGFLLGTVWAGTLVVVAATLGSTLVFLAARTAFADMLQAKAGPWVRSFEEGFRHNAFTYLLALRLMPVFPFWLVNIVPAMLGVSLSTYVLATVIGILPGTYVFASIGAGLGGVLDDLDEAGLGRLIMRWEVIGPLLGLSLLSLLPVAYRTLSGSGFGKTDPVPDPDSRPSEQGERS